MASSSSSIPAEFFKVFLPEHNSQELHICSNFKTNLLLEQVPCTATLKRPASNKKWRVALVKEGGEYFFKNGWRKFLEDNAVEIGEFLIFQYHGNLTFWIDIYATNGCEKNSARGGEERQLSAVKCQSEEEEESMESDVDDAPKGKRGPGRPPKWKRDGTVVQAAAKYMSRSDKPSFVINMTDTYVHCRIMHLPVKFVNKYMEKGEHHIILHMSGKSWMVKVNTYQNGTHYKLGDGFRKFVLDNGVLGGDICVFEMIEPSIFNVSVFRNN